MANTRIFISSICYDLESISQQLIEFITCMGHEPVIADYSDAIYDPGIHTSFVQEINEKCDILVVVIGHKPAGNFLPETFDWHAMESSQASINEKVIDDKDWVSLMQIELAIAIQRAIPIYAMVENRVWYDYLVFEKNKSKEILADIEYASIDDNRIARFIFEFIDFLREEVELHSIWGFSDLADIKNNLSSQWSMLFQNLLAEKRKSAEEVKKIDYLAEHYLAIGV